MSIVTASGVPDLKLQGMIPTFYADKVNFKYYAETFMPEITNSAFTGQVKSKGDKVVIPNRPDILISDYVDGEDMSIQYPQSTAIELVIARAAKYNVAITTIQEFQSQILLQKEYITDAVNQMRIKIEADFFADVYDKAAPENSGLTAGKVSGAYNLGTAASPLAVTKSNVVEVLMQARSVLLEQNANTNGIWAVIPQWMAYLLKLSDLKNAMITGDKTSPMRTGEIGSIDGMRIFESNKLKTATMGTHTGTYIMAGNKDAIAFCAQLVKSRVMEDPRTFATLVSGLHVYDWKVIKPEGLVTVAGYKA